MKINLLYILCLFSFCVTAQVTVFDNLSTAPRSLYESNGSLYVRENVEIRVWDNLPQNTDNTVVSSSPGFSDGFVIENNVLYYPDDNLDLVVRWDLSTSTQTFLGNNFFDGVNPDHITIVNGTIYVTADVLNGVPGLQVLLVYDNASDSFFIANGLGNGDITGIKADGTDIYILKRTGELLRVDVSNFNFSVTTINNLGNEVFGLEIENDLIYYTDSFFGELRSVSKSIVNDTPQTIATGFNLTTDVEKVGVTFYVSDRNNNTIWSYTPSCTVNIPDANLKTALLNHGTTITGTNIGVIDTNGDGEIQCSEANAYSGKLDLNLQSINDLTGLETFTSIVDLDISNNLFTSVDISALAGLVAFKADFMLASSIDFSGLSNLETVNIASGSLNSVTFANNSSLRILKLDNNQLSTIDLTGLSQLEELTLRVNQLSNLNLTQNSNLTEVNLLGNSLTTIDISQNTALIELNVTSNNISTLDVSQNTVLQNIYASNNSLSTLDISQNTGLSILNVNNNNLSTLSVSQNLNLKELYIGGNNFTGINLSQNSLLEQLVIYGNTNFSDPIDLSNNSNLKILDINDTQLTAIDLSNNAALEEVDLFSNSALSSVNMANGNNAGILYADFTSNPSLSCIQIDASFTPPTADWFKDVSANYSVNCSLSISDINISDDINIYPNPVHTFLNIESNNTYEAIEIYTLLGKKVLTAEATTHLNVSSLNSGMYLVKIVGSNNEVIIKRIIKD